jgi:hypothetical protein
MRTRILLVLISILPTLCFSQEEKYKVSLERLVYSIFSDYYKYDLSCLNVTSPDSSLSDQDPWKFEAFNPLYSDSVIWEFVEKTRIRKVRFNRGDFEQLYNGTCGNKKKSNALLWFELSNYFVLGRNRYFIYIDHAIGGEVGESALYEFSSKTYAVIKVYNISDH